jgi:hypothetical protein
MTVLRRRKFLKSSRHNGIQLLMLPSMSHDLVRICADKVTLATVEMGGLVLLT